MVPANRQCVSNAAGNVLPNWDQVEFFVLNGTNPANRPPVFKMLRWE